MNYYDGFALNIYALVLLLILLLSIFFKKEVYRYSSRLLRLMIFFISLLLVLEMLSWTFDGIDEGYAYVFNYSFNLLFFITGIGTAGIFTCYVDYMNYGSKERLRKRFYYMHMFVISLILVIINFFKPIIFSIDSNNLYSREPFMTFGFSLVYLLLLFMFFQTLNNRKNLSSNVQYSIYLFLTLPFIGGVIQLLNYGILIMWAVTGLGVIIAYIFTETTSNSKDYLTKLYTRSIANDYMELQFEKNNRFGLIVLDIDNFKDVNDTYGHKVGDKVLIHFSIILENTFPKHSIVSRFGGDEFVVIIEDVTLHQLSIYNELLKNNISFYKEYNILNKLKFSYGFSLREKDSKITIDDLLEEADKLMYNEKAIHKNYKRRISDR